MADLQNGLTVRKRVGLLPERMSVAQLGKHDRMQTPPKSIRGNDGLIAPPRSGAVAWGGPSSRALSAQASRATPHSTMSCGLRCGRYS